MAFHNLANFVKLLSLWSSERNKSAMYVNNQHTLSQVWELTSSTLAHEYIYWVKESEEIEHDIGLLPCSIHLYSKHLHKHKSIVPVSMDRKLARSSQ